MAETMTLIQGKTFQDFEVDGFSSFGARAGAPFVVFLWRTGCPTCRLALPFFDRLARRYPGASVVGVSQDDAATTEAYCRESGVSMRQLIDEGLKVSRELGLVVVPAYAVTDASGEVLEAGNAWDAGKLESIGRIVAERLGVVPEPLVTDADEVPAFKPG